MRRELRLKPFRWVEFSARGRMEAVDFTGFLEIDPKMFGGANIPPQNAGQAQGLPAGDMADSPPVAVPESKLRLPRWEFPQVHFANSKRGFFHQKKGTATIFRCIM